MKMKSAFDILKSNDCLQDPADIVGCCFAPRRWEFIPHTDIPVERLHKLLILRLSNGQ
jgi:hypothetical protein